MHLYRSGRIFNGAKVLPPVALREVNCILKHVDRGCLSHIPPGRGTNRNERLHRELKRIIHNSRLGVELGYALLTCIFYEHNEKIRATKENRASKPIIARSDHTLYVGERFGLATARIKEASAQQSTSAGTEVKTPLQECSYASFRAIFLKTRGL